MRFSKPLVAALVLAATSATGKPVNDSAALAPDNPFAKESTLPCELPPFDKITDESFRPALLAGAINDQYSRLGGLASLGQNAAAGVGNAGLQTGSQISALLQQQGAAQAGGYLSAGRAQAGYGNAVANAFGTYAGLGGFNSTGGTTALPVGETYNYRGAYLPDSLRGGG